MALFTFSFQSHLVSIQTSTAAPGTVSVFTFDRPSFQANFVPPKCLSDIEQIVRDERLLAQNIVLEKILMSQSDYGVLVQNLSPAHQVQAVATAAPLVQIPISGPTPKFKVGDVVVLTKTFGGITANTTGTITATTKPVPGQLFLFEPNVRPTPPASKGVWVAESDLVPGSMIGQPMGVLANQQPAPAATALKFKVGDNVVLVNSVGGLPAHSVGTITVINNAVGRAPYYFETMVGPKGSSKPIGVWVDESDLCMSRWPTLANQPSPPAAVVRDVPSMQPGHFGYVYRVVVLNTEITHVELGALLTKQDIDAAIARAPQCNGGMDPLIAIALNSHDYAQFAMNAAHAKYVTPPLQFPTNPQVGQQFWDPTSSCVYFWDGFQWTLVSSAQSQGVPVVTTPRPSSSLVQSILKMMDDPAVARLAQEPATPKVCECGATKCGSKLHSSWCPMA